MSGVLRQGAPCGTRPRSLCIGNRPVCGRLTPVPRVRQAAALGAVKKAPDPKPPQQPPLALIPLLASCSSSAGPAGPGWPSYPCWPPALYTAGPLLCRREQIPFSPFPLLAQSLLVTSAHLSLEPPLALCFPFASSIRPVNPDPLNMWGCHMFSGWPQGNPPPLSRCPW